MEGGALYEVGRSAGRWGLGGTIRSSVLGMVSLIYLLVIQDVSLIRMQLFLKFQKKIINDIFKRYSIVRLGYSNESSIVALACSVD